MTKTEYDELMTLLGMSDKDIYGNTYRYVEGKVIVSGNIPKVMIQELAAEDSRFKDLMKRVQSLNSKKDILSKFELFTMEELVMFLLALDDYSLKEKTGLVGNSKEQFDDILLEILKPLMSKAKLDDSVIGWIRNNSRINELNLATLDRMAKRPLFKTKKSVYEQDFNHNIRRNIDSFDCSVNPYLLSENIFKKLEEILENVIISIDILDDDGVAFEVTSRSTLDKVRYYRGKSTLSFDVTYTDKDDAVVNLTHKYTEDGEIISVDRDRRKMSLNLTTGKINVHGMDEADKDNKYKEEIYQTILTATAMASNITEENMLKQKSLTKRFV